MVVINESMNQTSNWFVDAENQGAFT